MQLPAHGSNPHHLYRSLGIDPPERIIDFSVNTNPLGAPEGIKSNWQNWLNDIYDYPDPYFTELKQLIAVKEGVEENCILPGNGAAELITLIARYLHGKKVLIIHPAFSEYESACRNENCSLSHYIVAPPSWELEKESLQMELNNVDAVFFCHPNNPAGVQYDRHTIDWLIDACKQAKTLLIIDEAFYYFSANPITYLKEASQSRHLLVLRSLTKMYSIAGLRLGYLAGHPALVSDIGKRQPHWALNVIALKAGSICLRDQQHVIQTRAFMEKERERLFAFYNNTAYIHSPSAVNFYLFRDPALESQQELFTFLLRKGIVLRHTYNFPGLEGNWLRTAVKTEEENNGLMEALAEWKKES